MRSDLVFHLAAAGVLLLRLFLLPRGLWHGGKTAPAETPTAEMHPRTHTVCRADSPARVQRGSGLAAAASRLLTAMTRGVKRCESRGRPSELMI